MEQTIYFLEDPYPRGKDWPGLITNHCDQPFKTLNIDTSGNCYLCRCEGHLPISVGNILDFDQLEDVWLNDCAKQLQQTITDRTFTYCAVQHCGIINQNIMMPSYHIGINIDESCNLACPTCRRSAINHTNGPVYEQRLKMVNHLVKLINAFKLPMRIVMSGNGDPLASSIIRPLLLNWQPQQNQTIKLHTNGLLMKKLLPDSTIFKNISEFFISVDAGTKEVYEQVRQPGKFEMLEENLLWLSDNRPRGANITLSCVISSANATDIINFSTLCARFGFNGEYTKLDNWGTFDDYNNHDVITNKDHPLHLETVRQLKEVASHPHILVTSFLKRLIDV